MDAWLPGLFAVDPADWLIDTDQVRSSTLILLTLAALGVLAGALSGSASSTGCCGSPGC